MATTANQLRVTLISTELAYIVFAVSSFCSTTYFLQVRRLPGLFCFCTTKGFEPLRSIRVKKQPSGLFLANREEALVDEVKRAKRDSESHHLHHVVSKAVLTNGLFICRCAGLSRRISASAFGSRTAKYASPRLRPNCTRERPCSLSLFDLCFLTGLAA